MYIYFQWQYYLQNEMEAIECVKYKAAFIIKLL